MPAEKKQIAFERINEFFRRIFELKDSDKLQEFLRFLHRMPSHAPFNNALVFAQRPDCYYYATAGQWQKRFQRTVVRDARSMVILFPFGPVEFVYDYSDTEGEPVAEGELLHWWRDREGSFDRRILKSTIANCALIDIDTQVAKGIEYIREGNFQTWGYAARNVSDGKRKIVLHPRYNDPEAVTEAYGVLCHEIAHHLLGHLGQIIIMKKAKNDRGFTEKEIARERRSIKSNVTELEAELAAWIVFDSFGIEKRSEAYMTQWLLDGNDLAQIDMGAVLKVAGKIRDMGIATMKW